MASKDNEWQDALAAIDLSSIESLKKLKQEQDQLDARLQSMEELKSTFAEPVYKRVRDDYQQRLRALDEEAAPLKQTAREQYSSLRGLIERFEADHEAVKLDQQELELRYKLGEFDEKEFQRRIKAIEASVKEKAEARARGLEMKARFLEAFHAESELESPASASGTAGRQPAVTGRFATVPDDVATESRTTDMPAVRPDLQPNKTQIMSAVSVPAARPAAPPPPPAPAGGGATPGPNQLFQISLEQLRRGSPGAARTGLLTLLQQYPTSDLVPDAQFYLGEAYHQEGNAAGADSAYAAVVSGYPTSPRAPTALYKRALGMEEKGNVTGARGLLNDLVQRYPRSDEAALAKERLRTLK